MEPTAAPTQNTAAQLVMVGPDGAGIAEPEVCPDMFASMSCIPIWLWVVAGLAVLLIVGAILCVALRSKAKPKAKGPPPIPEFYQPQPAVVAVPPPLPTLTKAPPPLPPGYAMLPTNKLPATPQYPTLDEPVVHIRMIP
jgi:hypothetical protein